MGWLRIVLESPLLFDFAIPLCKMSFADLVLSQIFLISAYFSHVFCLFWKRTSLDWLFCSEVWNFSIYLFFVLKKRERTKTNKRAGFFSFLDKSWIPLKWHKTQSEYFPKQDLKEYVWHREEAFELSFEIEINQIVIIYIGIEFTIIENVSIPQHVNQNFLDIKFEKDIWHSVNRLQVTKV